jgi:hypothetical protein
MASPPPKRKAKPQPFSLESAAASEARRHFEASPLEMKILLPLPAAQHPYGEVLDRSGKLGFQQPRHPQDLLPSPHLAKF